MQRLSKPQQGVNGRTLNLIARRAKKRCKPVRHGAQPQLVISLPKPLSRGLLVVLQEQRDRVVLLLQAHSSDRAFEQRAVYRHYASENKC